MQSPYNIEYNYIAILLDLDRFLIFSNLLKI